MFSAQKFIIEKSFIYAREKDDAAERRALNGVKFFPRRLSFPKLCDILLAYLNAGADKEYVGVSDVVGKSNINLHNISRNNNFLKSWNFIEESEKEPGKYRLSKEAAEFAHAYRIDPNGNLAKEMLKSLLSKNEEIVEFIERLKREKLSREAILVELPRVVGDLRADKVGLGAFLDMITYAFQLEGASAMLKTGKTLMEIKTMRAPSKVKRHLPMFEGVSPRASISINLTLSPEVSPQRLKEYIKAMLEAYEEYGKEE